MPAEIFNQLTSMNPADKTNEELTEVIINAGNTVEVGQLTKINLGIMGKPQTN
jgi:hypothetical protein